ncbi:MAG TPA: imidazole glycerol phosphate synthase subunit HisH [Anaerolineae bacterium]|nr:imidazole glycerol phosphate synthase subunit HisH [Anaerolineae bacterium]
MIVIVDYGVGNLRSVQKALERVGATAVVTSDPDALDAAQGVVLPGVGAFGDGMDNLQARRLVEPILRQVENEKPLLGICLGMQLLFEESEEMGLNQGLGLLPGRVVRFPDGELKVPHIGWNQLRMVVPRPETALLEGINDGAHAYFVHSYYPVPAEPGDLLATTEYGLEFASVVGRGRIWGAQFHPEKSQDVGLRLLQNYARLVSALAAGG